MTMTKKIIFALFFGSFWAAGSALAQPPAGASSLAPATNSETKKDAHDDKREELKSKLLKRKMELDGERIQTTTTKSTERQLIRPDAGHAQAAPAAKPKENKEKK